MSFENEEEEQTPEQKQKRARLKHKMNEVMSEMADLMIDDETKGKVEDQLKEVFKDNGLTYSFISLNAFLHGMEFACAAYSSDPKMTMMVMCVLRSIVDKRKVEMSKTMPTGL